MHQLLNQTLHGEEGANHHDKGGEDQRGPVHELDFPRVGLLKHPEMHHRGEHERRDDIAEVSDDAENVLEERNEIGDEGDEHDLHDAEDDVHGVGDEVLSLGAGAPVSLDHLVDGLHPERESADDGDDHQQVDRDGEPRAVGERLQDVALHAVRWE